MMYWYLKLYEETPVTIYQGGFEILGFISASILNLTNDIAVTIKLLIFFIINVSLSYMHFRRQISSENIILPM